MAKKTLYHSELAGLGPVRVQVQSDVLKSKYQGKPDYVVLLLNGEERNYNSENPACAAFFSGQKGRVMTIQAHGSRDQATIQYLGEPGANVPPPQQAPAYPPPTAYAPPAPPPQTATTALPPGAPPPPRRKGDKVDQLIEASVAIGKIGVAMHLCATELYKQVILFASERGMNIEPEAQQGMLNEFMDRLLQGENVRSMVIQLDRMHQIENLPSVLKKELTEAVHKRVAERQAAKTAPAPAPAPPPPPPPPPPAPVPAEPENDVPF